MHFKLFFVGILSLVAAACSSGASVQKSWVDKDVHTKDLQGVLVIAVASSEEGRRAFEQEFTRELTDEGVHAVASYSLAPGKELSKEDIGPLAQKAEVDTVLVTLFAGRDETAVLHPGRKYYSYAPIYGRDYYGRGRVYGVPYQVGQTQDFWAEHKSLHLEASLYQVSSEELLWRASSGIEESDDIAAMGSALIDSFMQDLAAKGLVD